MFGPLAFENETNSEDEETETECLVCSDKFNLKRGLHIFLGHLFEVHNFVIEDVQNIRYLPRYISYWKERFSKIFFETIIPSVAVESANTKYYLLSTLIKEDLELRHKLQLEHVLKVQQFERTDTSYMRSCLFCRLNFEGKRRDYLHHLSEQHNLQLGNADNLVFIGELLDVIEGKINNLMCIYCEKTFPDRAVLKEHMRKKLHKRINPQNKCYDKYFVVNYLEVGKGWQEIEQEDDRLPVVCGDVDSDEEYYDWKEKADEITCLLCQHREADINKICEHMKSRHNFDFCCVTQKLDFYQKIKLVNYVRKQMHNKQCIMCDVKCEQLEELLEHMEKQEHLRLPSTEVFDQALYYFPTYENDTFLYLIDDVED